MPLNLLKRYPELLELAHLNENARWKSLRGIFDRDITNNESFSYEGRKIYPIKADGMIDMEREFSHLTTESVEDSDSKSKPRVYDAFRSERLHWIKPHIEKRINDSEIEVFSVVERDKAKRVDVKRTYIYNKTRKYVIVLEPQTRNGRAYYLLTAYYLNKAYGEKAIKKKMKKKLEEVL